MAATRNGRQPAHSVIDFDARAARADELQAEVEVMTRDRARVEALVQRLETIEAQYTRIRDLFGRTQEGALSDVWLPPSAPPRRTAASTLPQDGPTRPSVWPLTERGFVTRGLHEGLEDGHPGLDIAVASDSYIRAAGGGTVIDIGEDLVCETCRNRIRAESLDSKRESERPGAARTAGLTRKEERHARS